MDRALSLLEKFALDAQKGKIPEDKLRFGAPWRHPPKKDDPCLRSEWAKLQLMDFIQCLVNAEFGVHSSAIFFFLIIITVLCFVYYHNIIYCLHLKAYVKCGNS